MREFHPFDPIVFENSKILILGTFPSFKSIEDNFYYSHKQNQFWRLLASIYNEKIPTNIDDKIYFLKKYEIALWDMVKSCKRENSLDNSLKEIEVNNIELFLKNYPNIEHISFTGKRSQKLFEKNFSYLKIRTDYLPSPSPAYKKLSFKQKLKIWQDLINPRDKKSTNEK